ncbi:SCP2 sterol-binding domain-containing protein [Micromonospora sp. WMMD1082]|uniref:SCP2 sterol-binding domain-containing protein n=1 Tax=Micromonospora sp. WMMD1082 TaxID=3016104 RepID=UPI00241765F7|nr:SCP2 sterol-binding domain-containing protein [Micromonospora sp. WMMD1082]MDG4793448.1 SCP2 sterol-binding domain-containing protein [Micromonospora sp. WMMD1082]
MAITVDPGEDRMVFARQVKAASDAELTEMLTGHRRTAVLDGLVRGMPDVFRADRAGTLDAVVHWRVTGRADGADDVFELRIADGRCVVSGRPERKPRLVLRIDGVDFVKMTTGNADARMLFLRGRLRARGNLALVNKFPGLFEVPKP